MPKVFLQQLKDLMIQWLKKNLMARQFEQKFLQKVNFKTQSNDLMAVNNLIV